MKILNGRLSILFIVISFLIGCQTIQTSDKAIMVVAHRGGAALDYGNTIEAFENALMNKIDAIELDLHLSSDGILIVHHDPVVLDEEGKEVPIRELKAEYITSVIVGDNQHIPTFKEVLTLIRQKGRYPLTLCIEIKVDEKRQRYPLIEEKVLSALHEFSLIESSRILSFDVDTLITIQNLDTHIHTCALLSHTYLNSIGLGGAQKVVEDMLLLKVSSVGIKDLFLTHSLIKSLQEVELDVGVWTVNKKRHMRKFINMNVDFIISDYPLVLHQILQQ